MVALHFGCEKRNETLIQYHLIAEKQREREKERAIKNDWDVGIAEQKSVLIRQRRCLYIDNARNDIYYLIMMHENFWYGNKRRTIEMHEKKIIIGAWSMNSEHSYLLSKPI